MAHGPRLSEDELFSRVRERIRQGQLPVVLSKDVAAGYGGSGDVCRICDQVILSTHVEYELTDPRDGSQLALHLSCHAVWQRECVRRIARQRRKRARDTPDADPRSPT